MVDGDAEIPVIRDRGLTGVQAHPHPELAAIGPRMLRQRPLRGGRRDHGVLRPRECDEQRVSLRVDLVPSPLASGSTEHTEMVGEDIGVAVSKLSSELRRALDIGEQERDGPLGKRRRVGIVHFARGLTGDPLTESTFEHDHLLGGGHPQRGRGDRLEPEAARERTRSLVTLDDARAHGTDSAGAKSLDERVERFRREATALATGLAAGPFGQGQVTGVARVHREDRLEILFPQLPDHEALGLERLPALGHGWTLSRTGPRPDIRAAPARRTPRPGG
jgi:hypothetical protein